MSPRSKTAAASAACIFASGMVVHFALSYELPGTLIGLILIMAFGILNLGTFLLLSPKA